MRLIRAEVLKLVRRRGLMTWCALLTVGSVIVAYGILLALHAANASRHGPAGGAHNLENLMFLLGGLSGVAAVLLGTTAGSQDVQAGVFRDLVVTGRPRSTLFSVRYPGALLVFAPLLLVGFGLAVGGSYAFAGGQPTATGHEIADYAGWIGSLDLVNLALGVGLTAFASSRIIVGVLIAWNAIVSRILIQIDSLGGFRKVVDVAAGEHFAPAHAIDRQIAMSSLTAAIVLVAWAAIALRAGRWWTQRLDA
jgi:hypothetical protein